MYIKRYTLAREREMMSDANTFCGGAHVGTAKQSERTKGEETSE